MKTIQKKSALCLKKHTEQKIRNLSTQFVFSVKTGFFFSSFFSSCWCILTTNLDVRGMREAYTEAVHANLICDQVDREFCGDLWVRGDLRFRRI